MWHASIQNALKGILSNTFNNNTKYQIISFPFLCLDNQYLENDPMHP
jgi:hypothetical protein